MTLAIPDFAGDHRGDHGPFDIIGDVHGCYDELVELLERLGYRIDADPVADFGIAVEPPHGRKAIFLGDLVDRGPKIPSVLRLVMRMVGDGTALSVQGNHDLKLIKALRGKTVQRKHGLEDSLDQLAVEPMDFRAHVATFLAHLPSHYVLDAGGLVVAHAGLKEELQGRDSGKTREFTLYGETTGEIDEFGLPVRLNWAADYRGEAMVVYGHSPVAEAKWQHHTIDIDTGCVFGGRLTALRYPERELVSVPARAVHFVSPKPLAGY